MLNFLEEKKMVAFKKNLFFLMMDYQVNNGFGISWMILFYYYFSVLLFIGDNNYFFDNE